MISAPLLANRNYKGRTTKLWLVEKSGKIIGAYVTADGLTPGIFGLGEARQSMRVMNRAAAIGVVQADIQRHGGNPAAWEYSVRKMERMSEGWYVYTLTNGIPITSYIVSPEGTIISTTPGH